MLEQARHFLTLSSLLLTYFTLEVFMTWVFVGAIMNLIAMGIGYLLTKKYRKK